MKFDIVLKEVPVNEGLTREDMMFIMEHLNEEEFFLLELEAKKVESSAMGLIGAKAAEVLDYDYEGSGLHDYIALILDDVENETPHGEYSFCQLSILIYR